MLIGPGVIDIGVDSVRFVPGDVDSLLRSYLMVVRRTRNQRRAVSITLRRDDIEAIADHLDQTAATVLERLADLMGSTRTQRAAMLTLLATGAMLIAATGSVAAEASPSAADVVGDAEPAVTLDVGHRYPARQSSPPGVEIEDGAVATPGFRGRGAMAERLMPTGERVTFAAQVQSDSDEVGVIIGDDNEHIVVAVGAPPVPPQSTGAADEPPIEVVESAEVVESTRVVEPTRIVESADIVEPVETGVADDGSTVAVGLPPIPPLPPSSDGTSDSAAG